MMIKGLRFGRSGMCFYRPISEAGIARKESRGCGKRLFSLRLAEAYGEFPLGARDALLEPVARLPENIAEQEP
jgi:hypothetical protein